MSEPRRKAEPRKSSARSKAEDPHNDATPTSSSVLSSVPNPNPAPISGPDLFLNRELSWLEFNARVLSEAEEAANPLLERLKFIAIFESNLDEFFMKRVGGLKRQVASGIAEPSPDGLTPIEQLNQIRERVRPMIARQRGLLANEIAPELAAHGVEVLGWNDITEAEQRHLEAQFEREVFPILTPLAVDPAHPFPFISNLSLSLAGAVRAPAASGNTDVRFARVKVPGSLPRWLQLPGTLRFTPLESVIAANLGRLFPGVEIVDSQPFRVTRNSDVKRNEEEADDLLEAIQEELRERRFATVVRLEVAQGMPSWMRDLLCDELEVKADDVYEVRGPLALRDLLQLYRVPLPTLKDRPWSPLTPPRLLAPAGEDNDIFATIAAGDLLVHHPYDSFATSVQRFLDAAADDPSVLAIKQTLYRTSSDSKVMSALIRAAEVGKQVAATIEIKARFDEEANIEWAEALEEVGAHVAYGMVGLKTHTKVALVARQEKDGLRTYAHIATGNYNAETAKLYTDLGLFTANPELAADVAQLFNVLTGYVHEPKFKKLLVAPFNMRRRFLELIAREVEHQRRGAGGRIVAKMNSLEDREIVEALYAASAAGVEIDLIVRGICRLRPGLPRQSETIRVRSIVGRFLEHARIFCFENAGAPEYFFGSADWMSRNLDWRVEAITPVEDLRLQAELRTILDLELADNTKAWQLTSDGSWNHQKPAPNEPARNSQEQLMQRALERSGRTV